MRIVFVFADTSVEWNCSQWRCTNPAYGLRRIGVDVDLMWQDDWAASPRDAKQRERVQRADVVLLQRNCFGGNLEALKFWRGLGKPVWIDLDDAYQMLPECNSAHKFWQENARGLRPPPLDQLREGLKLATGLTSPSKVILADWESPQKRWLPNFVRGEWYAGVKRRPHEGIIIGWGASMSHHDSYRYSGVVDALRTACERDKRVRVVVCSNDRRPFEMLDGISERQRFYQTGVPPEDWPQFLAQFDLGIAPLYGEYDRRRSWLKAVEYACGGVPAIVSDSDSYQEPAVKGWPLSLVGDGPGAWTTALDSALSQLAEAQDVATRRLFEACMTFSIESQAGVWLKGLAQ